MPHVRTPVFGAATLAVLLSLCVLSVKGDVWVSSSGSDTNSGSVSQPVRSLTRAIFLATPSSTIWLVGPTLQVNRQRTDIRKPLTIASVGPEPTTVRINMTFTSSYNFLYVNTTGEVSFRNIVFDATEASPDTMVVLRSVEAALRLEHVTILCQRYSSESCFHLTVDSGTADLDDVAIDGGKGMSFTKMSSASNVWTNLRVTNVYSKSTGAIYIISTVDRSYSLIILDSYFAHNSAKWGAALIARAADVHVRNSTFEHNFAEYGGAIYTHSGSYFDLEDCRFQNNSALEGGAVYLFGGEAHFLNSEFLDNSAVELGGSLMCGASAENMTIEGCLFERSSAGGQGGAIYTSNPITIQSSRFIDNILTVESGADVSWYLGGAILISGDADEEVYIRDSTFKNNYIAPDVFSRGGAIAVLNRAATIVDCSFEGNTASKGGALYLQDTPHESIISGTTFRNGTAGSGAGVFIYCDEDTDICDVLLERTLFDSNRILPYFEDEGARMMLAGAGIFVTAVSNITLVDSTLQNSFCFVNDAMKDDVDIYGCGLMYEDSYSEGAMSYLTVENSTFANNLAVGAHTARGGGLGILSVTNATVVIRNSKFENNSCESYTPFKSFAYGTGLLVALSTGNPYDRIDLLIEDTVFLRNSGQNAALWLEDVPATVRRCLFKENHGIDIVGGVQVFASANQFAAGVRDSVFEDCTWDSNFATSESRPGSQSAYHDLMVFGSRNSSTLNVDMIGNNRFLNHRANVSQLFGSSITVASNSKVRFLRRSLNQRIELPPILQFGISWLDLSELAATIETLKLWWGPAGDSGFNTVYVGDYDVAALGSNSFHHSAVVGKGTSTSDGRFILRGRSYTVGDDTPKRFEKVTVVNEGRMEHYACRITLEDSVVLNQENSIWLMPLFNPQSLLVGPGKFENRGEIQFSTAYFENIELNLLSTSKLTYQITNFWRPSVLTVIGTGSSVILGGTLQLDTNPVRQFSEPNNRQRFSLIQASVMSGSFSSITDVGGYKFRLTTSTDEVSATVTSFYPTMAQLSDDGSRINVIFPRATNIPIFANCSRLLDASTLTSLSRNAECSWSSDRTLLIKSTRNIGHLRLRGGVIHDPDDPTFSVPDFTVGIASPLQPKRPEIILVAPQIHPTCSDLVLDASATYFVADSSQAQFTWSVSPAVPSIQSFLIGLPSSSMIITLPSSLISVPQTLTFTLSVRNSLGQTSSILATITFVTDLIPIVYFEGPARRTIASAHATQLVARAEIPACSAAAFNDQKFNRRWVVTSSEPLNCDLAGSASEFTLYIPQGCLTPQKTYTLKFSLWPESNPSSILSQSVTLDTIYSPFGLESSGMSGLVDQTQRIDLAVSLTDPDERFWQRETKYGWQTLACPGRAQLSSISSTQLAEAYLLRESLAGAGVLVSTDTSSDVICEHGDGTQVPIPVSNTSQLSFAANYLPQGEYLFGVTARRGERIASELIYLNVTKFDAGITSRVLTIKTRQRTLKTLAQERLVLKGFVDGTNIAPPNAKIQWSDEQLSTELVSNPSNLLTSSDNVNLVIKPDSLMTGSYYSITLNLKDGSTDHLLGSTRRVFGVNSAPANGKLTIKTTNVKQFGRVSVSADGWVDSDSPLRYVFSIASGAGTEMFLSEPLDVPSTTFIMPFAGPVTLILRVLDAEGAEARTSVSLNAATADASDFADTKANFERSIKLGDFRSANQEIFALLSSVNAASTAATSLREEIAASLRNYVSSTGVVPTYVPVLVKSLQLLTQVSSGVSASVSQASLSLLEASVDAAVTSKDVAATLISSNSVLSRYSAEQFLRTVANVAAQIRGVSQEGSSDSKRVLDVLDKLLRLQATIAEPDEFALVLADPSSSLNLTSIVLSGKTIADNGGRVVIPLTNVTVTLNLTLDGIDATTIQFITWSDGTFPQGILDAGLSTGKVITALLGGSNLTDIGVDFDESSSTHRAERCAVYDEAKQFWDSSKCYMLTTALGRISCKCKTSGASGRVSITVIFGAQAMLTPDESAAEINIGAAVGISIGVCAVAGILFFVTVRIIRKRRFNKSKSSAIEKLKSLQAQSTTSSGSGSSTATQALLPPRPSLMAPLLKTPWKRAVPKRSGLLDDSEYSEEADDNDEDGIELSFSEEDNSKL